MKKEAITPPNIFTQISSIIETSRQTVYTTVNTEIVLMYWHIGEAIKTGILKSEKAEYGKAVIEELSKSLTVKYGRGFSGHDFSEPWADEKLYAKYGVTKEEQAFIESMIRPMEVENGVN